MITSKDLVRISPKNLQAALRHGEAHPEPGHANPLTGILRSAGRWLLENVFPGRDAEPVMLRMQTTQVIGRMLYVPIGFLKHGHRNLVAIYVHMPKGRHATSASIKGITIAGWIPARQLRALHVPGTALVCTGNGVLAPMDRFPRTANA